MPDKETHQQPIVEGMITDSGVSMVGDSALVTAPANAQLSSLHYCGPEPRVEFHPFLLEDE